MDFSFLTYNTLYNNGLENIKTIIEKYRPDIVCLQEVRMDEDNLDSLNKYGYRLADYGNAFMRLGVMYGIATFYNKNVFQFKDSSKINKGYNVLNLFFVFLSFLLGYGRQKTFLEVDLTHKKTNKKVSICNTHLFVIGSNALRVNHIDHVLKTLNIASKGSFVMAGDFNYLPYQRSKLEKVTKKYHLKEATRDLSQTIKFSSGGIFESFGLFQKLSLRIVDVLVKNLKIDYIFYKGLRLKKTERIEVRFSDHFPIISTFTV